MNENLCKIGMSVGFEVFDEFLSLIGVSNMDEFAKLSDEVIVKKIQTIRLTVNNYKGIVEQNKNLQKENIQLKKNDIRNLPANEVDIDYPAGYKVVAYSFYSFLDSILHVGVVKARYFSQSCKNIEKIYIGIVGCKDLKKDLEHIVLYGQKVYEETIDA